VPDADALFVALDDSTFQPTDLCRGPWTPDSQHGGPGAALVARAIVAADSHGPMQVARLTLELLRPVPLAPLRLETAVPRPGRKVQLVEASVFAGDIEVLRGRALRIRIADVADADGHAPIDDPLPPIPDATTPFAFDTQAESWEGFHNTAVDVRFVEGSWAAPGPAAAWFRLTVPVVAGEEISPLARVLAAADFGNGISRVLDSSQHLFINPDLTVHVARPPEGEWVAMRSSTTTTANGIGMAESALFDQRGRVGRAVQSLLVDPR